LEKKLEIPTPFIEKQSRGGKKRVGKALEKDEKVSKRVKQNTIAPK
jgi:hypothetical protein